MPEPAAPGPAVPEPAAPGPAVPEPAAPGPAVSEEEGFDSDDIVLDNGSLQGMCFGCMNEKNTYSCNLMEDVNLLNIKLYTLTLSLYNVTILAIILHFSCIKF